MPCHDYGIAEAHYDDCKRRKDDIVRMFCAVLSRLESEGVVNSYTHEVKGLPEWWEDHKERDRQRLAAEAAEKERKRLRRSGLKKLTKAEREALDL